MKRIIYFILFFCIAVFSVSFALLNAETVKLNYYFGSVDTYLSLIIVLSLVIGSVLGIIASFGMLLRMKHEIAQLHRAAKLTEKEVENLRSLPLKENN